jgi:hypothetical protein
MKKVALIYGGIAGLITGGMFFIMHPSDGQMDFEGSEIGGYVTMIVALTAIFFAVKHYRDKHLEGDIRFGQTLSVGLLVTLVASLIYVASWEAYSATLGGDFADQYMAFIQEELGEQAKSDEKIQEEIEATAEMMEMYKSNAAYRIGLTFLEIFPIGFLISLLTAVAFTFLLKRKPA